LDYVDKNLSLIAALTPRIGAEMAARIVREALNTGRNLREIVLEKNILSPDKLNELFNLDMMTEPG
jgi:aspartate ammonia-lyase